MPLSVGDRLGPYEILAPIGEGGMGEVYRARDTKLKRDVALKVLPEAFARDPDRMARFQREAEVLASLNHPNIAAIYGVEQSALVMELVEGNPPKGPLPFDEAWHIASQIAAALEYAHEKGVMHRDLKPANVKVTPEGVVKLLDFGLAKAFTNQRESPVSTGENSPTLTLGATEVGVILGTAGYMAPEQARGKPVDKRADIWSFGVLLYELLIGERLFRGEDAAETLAAVIHKELDLAKAPRPARRLLEECLQKDPKQRLRDIGDAKRLLGEKPPAQPQPASRHRSWLPWCIAVFLLLALMPVNILHFRETRPSQQSYRFQIAPPPNTRFTTFRLSPDGRYVAFVVTGGQVGAAGAGTLWIRALDSLESHQIAGSEGSSYPFWSPNNAFVGFFQAGKLKKVAATGGPAQTICDVVDSRGGAWGPDGTILFTDGPARPLFRVPSSGGKPVQLTKLSDGDPSGGHRAPEFLPDGRHFLFQANANSPEATGLEIGSLDGGAPVRVLQDNANGVYLPGPGSGAQAGYVLFLRDGTLMALSFDAARLKATGEAFPVAENVGIAANNLYGAFSAAGNGTLAYWGGGAKVNRELVWMDRDGKRLGTLGKPNDFGVSFALSPDEKTLAATVGNGTQTDIWLMDAARGTMARFTFGFKGFNPVWSSDGRSIVYSRPNGAGAANDIVRRQVTGGTEELLLENIVNAAPKSISSDGRFVVHDMSVAKTGFDIGLLAADGDRRESVYLGTAANERSARFSPDGKWMAYQSDESGQVQVYVQTIPIGGGEFQISTAGGSIPAWRHDGKELYYLAPDQKLMAVPVKLAGTTFEQGTPQALFTATGATGYAVTREGQRFLLNLPAGGEAAAVGPPLTIITNWSGSIPQGSH